MHYDTYAKIDLDALEYNINKIKTCVAPAKIQAVLKADAYGHIAKEIFKYLIEFGIENYAVANLIEALELRKINKKVDIMVYGKISKNNLLQAIKNCITINIFSKETADNIIKLLKENPNCQGKIHIKLNTGFNRLGFDNEKSDLNKILELGNVKNLEICGIYSHFALESLEEDQKQYQKYQEIVKILEDKNMKLGLKHIADSIAAIDYPWARMDMVRIGAAMYGLRTPRPSYDKLNLKGTLSMHATINQIRQIQKGEGISYDYKYKAEKPMKIGTISIGYADGLPRALSNQGSFYIKGQQAKILGLMCMDQCMIDLSNIKDVKEGDEVLLYETDSKSIANIGKISTCSGTNKNEILTGIGKRVPRIYTYKGKIHIKNQLLDKE